MSRMLEALKLIETKRLPPQPPENKTSDAGRRTLNIPVRKAYVKTPAVEQPSYVASRPAVLRSATQEELLKQQSPKSDTDQNKCTASIEQSVKSDSFNIEKILVRAESAVDAALSSEESSVYADMAKYIAAQLTPGRHAAFLFTSPYEDVEKSETILSLSKALDAICGFQVSVLNISSDHDEMRLENMPNISKDLSCVWEKMTNHAQVVLIDAPSLANVRTAPMLSKCDGVYLVAQLGRSTPYYIHESVRVIKKAGGRLLGCIAVE